jgi:2-dehydropantoate 2-reductase
MRIAIYGTGGVGGYYGARLAGAGHEVWFIARGEHLNAIRANGLRLESGAGDVHVSPTHATDTPADVGIVDLVILAVKTWQVVEAAEAMRPMIGATTMVLPLQNGVEAASQVAGVLGDGHVLGGESRVISLIAAPGVIRHVGGPGSITFGEWDSKITERAEGLRDTLNHAAIPAEISTSIESTLWAKLLFVAPVGGVGSVTRAPIGIMRSQPETRAMVEGAMQEIYEVATARSISLPDDAVRSALAFLDRQPAQGTASLYRDIIAGKPSELEAWNGAVDRLGREVGIATPIHTFIYHALLPLERRARGLLEFA